MASEQDSGRRPSVPRCPNCGSRLSSPDDTSDDSLDCPSCGASLVIEGGEASLPTAALDRPRSRRRIREAIPKRRGLRPWEKTVIILAGLGIVGVIVVRILFTLAPLFTTPSTTTAVGIGGGFSAPDPAWSPERIVTAFEQGDREAMLELGADKVEIYGFVIRVVGEEDLDGPYVDLGDDGKRYVRCLLDMDDASHRAMNLKALAKLKAGTAARILAWNPEPTDHGALFSKAVMNPEEIEDEW